MTATVARCEARVRSRGEDRPCGQTVGLVSWTDHLGGLHHGCPHHQGGLKRRYPAEVPERTAPSGTLGLGTPWTRGRFAPGDVIAVENAIPAGYRINVIGLSPHRFVVVGLRASGDPLRHPVELFRTPPTSDPYRVALGMCERLSMYSDGSL
jgi:hypothetical protein